MLLLALYATLLSTPALAILPLPRMFLSPQTRRARAVARAWAPLRDACEATPACAPLAEGEEVACTLRCLNPGCWAEVYGRDPLEPGQVDKARAVEFDACLRRAEPGLKAAGLWPPRLSGLSHALLSVAEVEVFTEPGGGCCAGGGAGRGASVGELEL